MRFFVNQSNQIPQKISAFSIFKTDSKPEVIIRFHIICFVVYFMNFILGLNAFHRDLAACVLRDGKLVAAVAVGNHSNANIQARVNHVLKTPLKSARGVATHFQRRS
jgi:hypothetical protein